MRRKFVSGLVCAAVAVSTFSGFTVTAGAATNTPQYRETARQMEKLNRGLIAVKTTADTREQTVNGVYLSWRLLGDESLSNQAFDIYRDGKLIHTTGVHDATNYIDTSGTASNSYQVVKAGESIENEPAVTPNPTNSYAKPSEVGNGKSLKNSFSYVDIPIDRPDPVSRVGDGSTSYYYSYDSSHEGGANDGSVGDLDGDGDYELVLKWDPTDSKDSAGADYTGNVYIDGYELDPSNENEDGTHRMWRIDMGKNVTAGAHYTQFIVYDFDGDGKSEIAMKTAPGTIDGTGHYVSEVGDTSEIRDVDNTEIFVGTSDNNYLGTGSSRLKGKNPFTQYLTIFDGETGAALYTTEYIPYTAAENKYWGDGSAKYNRSERYLAGVAYLDGVHPSIIMCRGYYHDSVIRAYNWDGSELTMLWEHVGKASAKTSTLYGQGNHNLSIGDIDNDGKDEIVYGSAALDDDGTTVLGNTYLGHGDAMHMNDFNNDGVQEVFSVKEESYTTYAEDLRVASTGKHFWDSGKITTKGDNGRGVMDNIDDAYASTHENALAIGWSSGLSNAHDLNGDDVATKPGSAGSGSFDNFLVFWDSDLSRELLDANIIQKYTLTETTDDDGNTTVTSSTKRFYGPSDGYSLPGGSTNNFSKRNYTLVADLWGDWREEIIMPINKGSSTDQAYLRIYTSTLSTDYRLTTLMHDCQYRESVAWQNVGYNQPTHTSYYIGSVALATDESGSTLNYLAPETAYTNVAYELNKVDVTGLTLDSDSVKVEKGKTVAVKANISPEDATRKGVKWESSDTSVATVSNGIVTGVSEGTATITATSKDNTSCTATCTVTVYQTHVTGVTMSSSQVDVGVGYTTQLNAVIAPSDATDTSLTWTTSNYTVATVDESGVVTGVAEGAAYITATTVDGGYSAQCQVNVLPLVTTDETNENSFTATGADGYTTITTTATSASITHKNATSGASVSKTFNAYSDNTAKISFFINTGGKKYDGTNWCWTDHEYSLRIKLLDLNGDDMVTLKQGYGDGSNGAAGKLIANLCGNESNVENWNVTGDMGNIQGSAKKWTVTVEFDYDSDTGVVSIVEANGADYAISDPFDLNGASFATLEMSTTVDGTGDILAAPSLSSLSYTRTYVNTDGERTTPGPVVTPAPVPTATPAPTPSPTPVAVVTDVTDFTAKTRVTISAATGDENEITITNNSNANNANACAVADFSDIIEGEDTYTVDYDSYVTSASRAKFELADISSRPGSTNKTTYDATGVAFSQGVVDSSSYAVNNDKTAGNKPAARDAWVHTTATVNVTDKTLTYKITDADGTTLFSGTNVAYSDTTMGDITGISYVDWINSTVAQIKNITVTTYKSAEEATGVPTDEPTVEPTGTPTEMPSEMPSEEPSPEPTAVPSPDAPIEPTTPPTEIPSETPSEMPSEEPSPEPENIGLTVTSFEITDGKVSATVEKADTAAEEETVRIITASYNADGTLKGVFVYDCPVADNEVILTEDMPAAPEDGKAKAFIWYGSKYTPLHPAIGD